MRKVYLLFFLLLSYFASQGQLTTTNCSGVALNYTKPGDPGGTTYTWFAPTGVGFTGGGIQLVGQTSLNQTLINTTTSPIVVSYSMNSSASGAFNLDVTLYPTPSVVGLTDQIVCNGAVNPGVSFTGSVAGTTFNWTNNKPSVGLAASGSGNIGSFTANNGLNIPVSAVITVTPVSNACSGTATTYSVTVNPTPIVNTTSNEILCNGTLTTAVNFSGSVSGATYNWTNNTPSIGLAASGSGNISAFSAANASNIPIIAIIAVTPVSNTCSGITQSYSLTINPSPDVTLPSDYVVCNPSLIPLLNFTGSVTNTSFNWTNTAPSIGLAASGSGNITAFTASNGGNLPVTAFITVTPVSNTCSGTAQTFSITVNPTPNILGLTDQVICNGVNTTVANFSSAVSNASFNWTNTDASIGLAASGTGTSIAAFAGVNASSVPLVAIIAVTPVSNTCSGTPKSFSYTINPSPTVNIPTDQIVCNPTFISAINFTGSVNNSTFNWTNTAASIGLAASGAGNIAAFTAVNASNVPVTAFITITPLSNTCSGTAQTFSITVNPTPTINAIANQTVCNGVNTSLVSFTGLVGNSTYNWTNNNATIGLAATGSGNIAAFAATNAANVPITALITVTPVSNTCSGNAGSFSITINPTPTLNIPIDQVVCNPTLLSSINLTGSVASSVYNWTNSAPAIGLSASGSGSIAGFTAVNASNIPIIAYIAVTPVSNSCNGTVATFSITVNPTPSVNSITDQVICNTSSTTLVNFTGSVSNAAYNWTNNTTSINLAGSGSGNISSFAAANLTNNPITALITVTPVSNTCSGTPATFSITVNPTPTVTGITDQVICNSLTTTTVNFTGLISNSTFNWTNNTPSIGLAASGTGTINSFAANNAGNGPLTAIIVVTPISNTCSGATKSFSYTVNPTPLVQSITPQTICNSALTTAINFTSTVINATFNWTNNSPSIGLGASASGNIAVFTGINNTSAPITAIISVTAVSNTCTGPVQTFSLTVNPTPTVNLPSNQIVCNGTLQAAINFTGSIINSTLYNWTNNNITIGLPASGTGNTASFTAINGLNVPLTANITVTPVSNTCSGSTQSFSIIINPTPSITAGIVDQVICNGTLTTAATFTSPVANTTFNWTNSTTSIGLSASSSGTINAFTGTNVSLVPVTGYINVTPLSNSCYGPVQSFSITVNPTPTVNSISNQSICNTLTSTLVNFTGALGSTTYNWINNNATIGLGVSGTGNITVFTGINVSSAPITALVVITPSSNSCNGATQNFSITINPTPTVNPISSQTLCNGLLTANVNFTGIVNGTTYNWTNSTSSIGLALSGTGTINAFTANNISGVPVIANLTVTPVSNTCYGSAQNFSFIVNPTPSVNFIANQALCNTINTTAINFGGLVSSTIYSWTNTTPSIGLAASGTGNIPTFAAVNTGTTPITAVIAVTTSSNTCSGGSQSFSITVNPTPVLTSTLTPSANCNGVAFTYTATSLTPGTSYSWNRAAIPSINSNTSNSAASANINEVLTSSNTGTVTVVYGFTLTANNCSNAQNVSVVINPTASFNSTLSPSPICTGTNFSYVASSSTSPVSFSWTRPSVAGITAGGAFSGTGNISETLLNTTTAPVNVSYYYTVSTSGCANSKTFTVTLTVNPTPVLSGSLTPTPICSNAIFAYPATSATTGTSFAWSRNVISGISSGGPISGTGNISETLINANNILTNVDYVYSLTANGCSNTQNVTIGVYPLPLLSSSTTPLPVCSNAIFNYTPSSTTGTSFNWARTSTSGISNGPASGINDPAETLVNVTPLPINVTYTYTIITSAGCSNPQTITVTVNPTPVLTSSLTPPSICSGNVFSYVPTSATPGTAFNWGRAVVSLVTNGTATGINNPGEILINPSINPAGVAYTYTLTANACSNNQTVSLTVNPIPVINAQTTATCSNTAFSITPANIPATTLFTWNNPVILPVASTIGGAAQASGLSYISQLLTNQTTNSATATYTVLPAATGCNGLPFTLTVTINPLPFVNNQLLTAVCSATPFSYTPSGIPAGTTYTWGIPTQNAANNLTGGGAQPVSQSLISQTLSSSNNLMDTAYYAVIPATALCIGNAFTLTVPVKPVPIVANLRDTICSGGKFQVTPSPVPANTTYTWSGAPISTPTGAITGGSAQVLPVSSLSQTLVNVTNAIAQAVYTIIPSAGNCPGPSFNLIETVSRPLPAFGNQPAVICSGTAFNATPPSAPGGTVYTWTIPVSTPPGGVTGMSAALTPVSSVSQTLVNLLNVIDTVIYTVTPYLNNCAGPTFTATVKVLPLPQAIISAQPAICQNPLPDTLTVKFTGTAPWSFTYNDNGTIGSKNGITSSPYTLLLPGVSKTATLRTVTISNLKDAACINSIDSSTTIQKINPLPVGQIISLHGTYLCNGIKDTLYIQSKDSLGYQWKFNGAQITGATTDSIATATAGTYQAILTNQYACTDTAAAPVTLILAKQPVLKFSFDTACVFSLINFKNLTDTSVTGTIQWLWSFGNGKTDTAMNTNTRYQTAGNYRVTLKASQLFCPTYPPTRLDSSITIQAPIPDTTLPSVSAYKGQLTPVNSRSFPGYQYQWTPSAGIVSPDSAATNFNYANTQQYTIKLISPSGCITNDSLLVRVFDNKLIDVMVPKSFTPNGDGVNDMLFPYLSGVKEFHYFRVLNRYGKLLFESKNPDTGWNGMVNGVQQPMGIYFWISEAIITDGTVVQKSGQVLLIR